MDTNIKKLGDNPAASDFSFTVTAPLEPGTYTLDYRTRQFSKLFDAEPLDLTKPPPPAVAEIMDGLQPLIDKITMDTNIKALPASEAENSGAWWLKAVPTYPEQKRRFDAWYDAGGEIFGGLAGGKSALWTGWIGSWTTNQRLDAKTADALFDHDLIEIARTIAAMATARERMTLEELQTAPCPLDPASPLVRAARAACVERGYGIDGEKGGGGNG